jgi:alpha-aminoadipic semialdehyde synthase
LVCNPIFINLSIASNIKEEALEIAGGRSRVVVAPLDAKTAPQLGSLVENHDLVVSFVPATMHPLVAEQCIKFKKNMVTASYISPAMKALHERLALIQFI